MPFSTKEMLKKQITENLSSYRKVDKKDLSNFIKQTQLLINKYELENYANYTEEIKREVAQFRSKVCEIAKNIKNENEETGEDEGIEILKMLNKQLILADINQNALEKGTIKLERLNYTNVDILEEISKANSKIVEKKNREKSEMRRIKWAYKMMMILCLLIILDKFYVRIIRPLIYVARKVHKYSTKNENTIEKSMDVL